MSYFSGNACCGTKLHNHKYCGIDLHTYSFQYVNNSETFSGDYVIVYLDKHDLYNNQSIICLARPLSIKVKCNIDVILRVWGIPPGF